jgi:hypothetical protein
MSVTHYQLRNCLSDFHEIRYRNPFTTGRPRAIFVKIDSDTVTRSSWASLNFYPCFMYFLIKVGTIRWGAFPLDTDEYLYVSEIKCRKSHTLLSSTFHIYCFIWVKIGKKKKSAFNTVTYLWVWPKYEHARLCFPYGRKRNFVYACIVKPYHILKVQNTFVKSVYWFTGYSIRSVIITERERVPCEVCAEAEERVEYQNISPPSPDRATERRPVSLPSWGS